MVDDTVYEWEGDWCFHYPIVTEENAYLTFHPLKHKVTGERVIAIVRIVDWQKDSEVFELMCIVSFREIADTTVAFGHWLQGKRIIPEGKLTPDLQATKIIEDLIRKKGL